MLPGPPTERTLFTDPLTRMLADFTRGIGIEVRAATLDGPTFFPGVDIQYGAIVIDEARLAHPADILHEAGHVAVTDPALRRQYRLAPNGGEEKATLAWSYAAALHLGVPVDVLFHQEQHNGHSPALIDNFTAGRYVGVPLLQWFGMTVEPRQAAARGVAPFPHMLRWVRCDSTAPPSIPLPGEVGRKSMIRTAATSPRLLP